MNLKRLLQHFTIELQDISDQEEITVMFYMAVDHISRFNRAAFMLKGEDELLPAQLTSYLEVLKLLKTGMPIQYVLGETLFYGLNFKLNPAVLIPRPETEELVEWIIESVGNRAALKIIDIGTGSGCIGIALKKNLPTTRLSALDISKSALDTASSNASLNQVSIDFIHADIHHFTVADKFDIIVSNPPYITISEKEEMHENVLAHEPHLALFVSNESPLVFYERIADFAVASLQERGMLFFEINEHLGRETVEMLTHKSFTNIELKKDMQGKDRMIRCELAL